MNELSDLYRQKGELITQLELIQAKLGQVNQAIARALNNPPPQMDQLTMDHSKAN